MTPTHGTRTVDGLCIGPLVRVGAATPQIMTAVQRRAAKAKRKAARAARKAGRTRK